MLLALAYRPERHMPRFLGLQRSGYPPPRSTGLLSRTRTFRCRRVSGLSVKPVRGFQKIIFPGTRMNDDRLGFCKRQHVGQQGLLFAQVYSLHNSALRPRMYSSLDVELHASSLPSIDR